MTRRRPRRAVAPSTTVGADGPEASGLVGAFPARARPEHPDPVPDPEPAPDAEPPTRATPRTGSGGAAAGSPVLPDRAAEDSDRGWGDGVDDNDDRLHRDRPPHWE